LAAGGIYVWLREIATIFITTTPRLLVVRRGPLCIKERETGVTLGRLLDHYDIFMTEKLKFKVFTRYLIFLGRTKAAASPLGLTSVVSLGLGEASAAPS